MRNFREVCGIFLELFDESPVAAHIYLGRCYLSSAESYQRWWQMPLSACDFRQAVSHVENALYFKNKRNEEFTPDQARDVAAIMAKVLGRRVGRGRNA